MKKPNKKHLALSIVAFVLVLMSLVSFTYSWIDDIKLVEFQNADVANGAPLKAGVDINSTINITSANNSINLGNILDQDSDLTFDNYQYSDGHTGKRTKYEGGGTGKEPNRNDIDSEKGYFYESGGMHLSPCYSDGETFYFPVTNDENEITGYREGNKDDENVNYISFTTKVSSPDANVDFWFGTANTNTITPPTITDGNGAAIQGARIAITIDGSSHVYSAGGTASYYNPSSGNIESVSGARKTTAYTFNHTDNNPGDKGKNGNTLFSIKKGSTVYMNIKVWLEGGTTGVNLSDININLVSSWAFSRKITIVDKTTTNAASSWIKNNGAKMYLTLPKILNDLNTERSAWDDLDDAPFYPLTKQDVGGEETYSVTVPMIYNNEEMILYRCVDTGWNNKKPSQQEINNGAHNAEQRSEYQVYCWNWWKSYIPNTFKNERYTLYGSSYDNVVTNRFPGTPTNKGYGTWADVEEIQVFSEKDNTTDYATKDNNATFFLRDFTDYDTTGEVYAYVMYRENNDANTPWKAYIPATSSKIQFNYFWNNASGTWGYLSWNNDNRQRRPLASTGLYTENSTSYYIKANYDNYNQGWGYWENADMVYLFKDGDLASTDAYAYIYNTDSDYKQASPGEKLSQLTYASGPNQGQNVIWKNNIPVYYSGSAKVYKYVKFNNDNGSDSGQLVLFPGCFYHYSNPKWYGSLDDIGAAPSGGGSGGGDTPVDDETDTMDGYSTDTSFVFKVQNQSGNAEQSYYAKSNSDGSKFKVDVYLKAGDNWTTILNGSNNYRNGKQGESYNVGSGFNGINLDTSKTNNFAFKATEAGNYIITFSYGNQTSELKIEKALKKAS